jgi:hypothetical protein
METLTEMEHLTRRVEDHERRIGSLEAERRHVDAKFDSLEELINVRFTYMQASIDGWNKIGFWLLTAVGGPLIVAVVGAAAWFIVTGGPK